MISPKTFSRLLFKWSDLNPRIYPWTGEKDPYKIWISEIILQQTRSEQAKDYYLRFINTFPNIKSLALATEDEVLNCWKGLGYYTRARNLCKTAKILAEQYQMTFPKTYEEILALQGIGDYTAAAISSFAYNIPKAVVDGNVIRLLSRLCGIPINYHSSEGKKLFHETARHYLNIDSPAKYNQAIMDFGATYCKPTQADCMNCLFKTYCVAYSKDIVADLPLKNKKKPLKKRYFHFFLLFNNFGELAIEQRTHKDIWYRLYQLPLIETNTDIEFKTMSELLDLDLEPGLNFSLELKVPVKIQQKLSHQEIVGRFYNVAEFTVLAKIKRRIYFVKPENLANFAFPKIIREFFEGFKKI